MKEFFQNLKEKRQEKKISLMEIHRRSRLPLEYLKAIEAGDVEELPHAYERIYLRRYAKEIGLDADEVIHDYDLLTGKLTPPIDDSAPPLATEEKSFLVAKGTTKNVNTNIMTGAIENLNLDRINKYFWISLAALLILALGFFTYQQYQVDQDNRNLNIKEIPISELEEQSEPKDSLASEQNFVQNSAAANSQLPINVELHGKKKVWIREVCDATDTTEYILNAGIKHLSKAKAVIDFWFGVADGAEIWLNGQNLGMLGRGDQVARFSITSKGIENKRLRTVPIKPPKPFPVDTNSVNANATDSISIN